MFNITGIYYIYHKINLTEQISNPSTNKIEFWITTIKSAEKILETKIKTFKAEECLIFRETDRSSILL